MTPDEILEGNKLVAQFMGYTYFGHNDPRLPEGIEPGWKTEAKASNFTKIARMQGTKYLCRNHTQLRYYNDWNWIMEVVEKIDSMKSTDTKSYDINISKDFTDIYEWEDLRMQHLAAGEDGTRKENTFKALIDFIKKYNNDQVQSAQ